MSEYSKKDSLGRQIYFTAREIGNVAEKILKPHDLTLEQFQLLKNMSADKGKTQSKLGGLTGKSPANITRLLDRLEAKQLMIRRSDPTDRRVSLVFLTARGDALIREMVGLFETFSERLIRNIDPRDQEITRQTLEKITANVREMEGKAG